jgi:hypothetical protein
MKKKFSLSKTLAFAQEDEQAKEIKVSFEKIPESSTTTTTTIANNNSSKNSE